MLSRSKIVCILFLFSILPSLLTGQTKPLEGASLNYTIIGCSFPDIKHTQYYTVQIALGHYNNEDSFQKNIILTVKGDENKLIAQVPAFGKEYTWRAVYYTHHSAEIKSELHHFSTRMAKWVNTDSMRLRIITPATDHKDDYVFFDGDKALYDMTGHPVWYLPDTDGKPDEVEHPRDIKITPFGTITLLTDKQIYEINYNAEILWKGPGPGRIKKKVDSSNFHHHEFTRLANGNYMTFGFEHVLWPLSPELKDTSVLRTQKGKIVRDSNNQYYQKIAFGKLVEYDHNRKIVWEWRSSDYFKHSDLYYRRFNFGYFDLDDTHVNAFYFDEKAKTIYISFRNLNRVIKIQYPSGKLLSTFGKLYAQGDPHHPPINGMFCGQHSCRESQEGFLYVFNNNICHPALTPTIIMMRESPLKKDSIEKVWEFECPMDELTPKEKSTTVFNVGGSVFELPDRSIFCCMGSDYSKTFIVNRDKKILWCAQPEIWHSKDKKWAKQFEYRASIITREELEHLIWNESLEK